MMGDIERKYSEILRKTVKLHICTVPFIWKPVDRDVFVVSVEIFDIYEDYIIEELIPFAVDYKMFGVSSISLEKALERYKNEFLPILERFAKIAKEHDSHKRV